MSSMSSTDVNAVLDTIRDAIYRCRPLSEKERDAFIAYSKLLERHLDAIEDAQGGASTNVQALRLLLDAIPGIMV
jgi:hypothetical protein